MIKRIISQKARENIKKSKKFKNKPKDQLTESDIRELVILIAERLKLL